MESTDSVDDPRDGNARQSSEALRAELTQLRAENASLATRLEAFQQEIRQAESAGELAVGAVHDFRNALTVVLTEVELLGELATDPEQQAAVRNVSQAAAHAVALAKSILRSAARDRGNTQIQLGGALLEHCEPLLASTLQGKARLALHSSPDAWSVCVQVPQLEAALVNLVANARDGIGQGGTVRVGARNISQSDPLPVPLPEGEYVAFYVEDDGCGMSPSVLARARDAFFTTKAAGKGTGLGLPMVQSFATAAGGGLSLSSKVGRGTRVEVLLPRVPLLAPLDASDPRFSVLERLQARVRAEWLADLLSSWRKSCPREGLPSPARVEAELGARREQTVLVGVGPDPHHKLRVLRMGVDLSRELQRVGSEPLSFAEGEALTGLADAYRLVALSRTPSYEFVRYSLGEEGVFQFERLLLPASIDGTAVSHVVDAIVLPESATQRGSL